MSLTYLKSVIFQQLFSLSLLDLFIVMECLDISINSSNVRNGQTFSRFKWQPNDIVTCALDKPYKTLSFVSREYCCSTCHTGYRWSWFNHIADEDPTRTMMGDCELFAKKPQNISQQARCSLYESDAISLNSTDVTTICSSISAVLPAGCSFPFTNNGTLYNGCAPEIGCLTVNRTATLTCNSIASAGVINNTMSIGGQSVPVQSISGWIIWMRKVASVAYNWNSTWASYKNGFGSVGDSDYWLGLERVHQLTSSANYRLRIEMRRWGTVTWNSVEYWSFKVGDEATSKYRLSVDGFSGDTINGLQNNPAGTGMCPSTTTAGYANGMKFTTIDADNDLYTGYNCALIYGAGWWYNRGYCVLLTSSYMQWLDTTGSAYYLAEVCMMMKVQ